MLAGEGCPGQHRVRQQACRMSAASAGSWPSSWSGQPILRAGSSVASSRVLPLPKASWNSSSLWTRRASSPPTRTSQIMVPVSLLRLKGCCWLPSSEACARTDGTPLRAL